MRLVSVGLVRYEISRGISMAGLRSRNMPIAVIALKMEGNRPRYDEPFCVESVAACLQGSCLFLRRHYVTTPLPAPLFSSAATNLNGNCMYVPFSLLTVARVSGYV